MVSPAMEQNLSRAVLLNEAPPARTTPLRVPADRSAVARALRATARVFVLIGLVDLALNLFPPAIGNADWEFGILGPTLDGLPLLTIGLSVGVAAGIWSGQRWSLRLHAFTLLALVGLILALTGLYALALPIAWKAAGNGIRGPMILAIGKTTLLAVCYPLLYGWLAILAWRQARSAQPR